MSQLPSPQSENGISASPNTTTPKAYKGRDYRNPDLLFLKFVVFAVPLPLYPAQGGFSIEPQLGNPCEMGQNERGSCMQGQMTFIESLGKLSDVQAGRSQGLKGQHVSAMRGGRGKPSIQMVPGSGSNSNACVSMLRPTAPAL